MVDAKLAPAQPANEWIEKVEPRRPEESFPGRRAVTNHPVRHVPPEERQIGETGVMDRITFRSIPTQAKLYQSLREHHGLLWTAGPGEGLGLVLLDAGQPLRSGGHEAAGDFRLCGRRKRNRQVPSGEPHRGQKVMDTGIAALEGAVGGPLGRSCGPDV